MQWFLLILAAPYFLTLLLIYRYLRKLREYKPDQRSDLKVTVIIPCRNEGRNIGNILEDISMQDHNADLFEVIVVDDNSSDSTYRIAASFKGIRNLTVIKNKGNGKKKAIATGIDAASGELIVTTDADCHAGINWLSTIASFYSRFKPDIIICPVVLESRKGFFGKFQELEFLSLQGITAGSAAGGFPTMCNGANLAYSRLAFTRHSVNLHSEINSGDDIFLLHSLNREKGSKICWLESPASIVTASQSGKLEAFLAQRHRWISKGRYYRDSFTIFLALVTFLVIALQVALLFAWIADAELLRVFLVLFLIKSIPDFLILRNTACRYRKSHLLWWFFPSQMVYPFYVLTTVLFFTRRKEGW